MRKRLLLPSALVVFVCSLTGACGSVPPEQRIDNVPMYGQPAVPRPDFLKRADENFIRDATAGVGSREKASQLWAAKAKEHFKSGDFYNAMRRYNQSWLLDPNNHQPYWGFGQLMLVRSRYDEAIEYFEKAKSLIHDDYQKVALLADTAMAYGLKGNSLSPDQVEARSGFFALANKNFVESTTMDEKYENSWRQWARSLYFEGKYAEAWEKVKKARSLGNGPFPGPPNFLKDLESKMPEPK